MSRNNEGFSVSSKMFKYIVSAVIGMCLLSGCDTVKDVLSDREKEPTICLRQIDISLDSDANMDSATSVDLLVIYRKDLLDVVMKMTAREYFATFMQLKRDYPEMIDIWHWELTPGQVLKDYPIMHRDDNPVGAVFFADYMSLGDHRVRCGQSPHAHVRLKKFDFCVLEQGCSSEISQQSITSRSQAQNPQVDAMQGGLKSPAGSQNSQGQGTQNPMKLLKKEESDLKKEVTGLQKEAKSMGSLFSK